MAMCNVTRVFLVCLIFTVSYPECSIACMPGMNILKCVDFFQDTTIFLPTDHAFGRLPADVTSNNTTMREILLFHLLPQFTNTSTLVNEQLLPSEGAGGQSVRFNKYSKANTTIMTTSGAVILRSDENATNGVINIVDRVMYPRPTGSLYEYVANTGSYQTLLLLAAKASLLDSLKGGTYTMFAPNDNAFSKLPSGAVANLLSNIPKLKMVLENHLVSTTLYSAGLGLIGTGKTLSGSTFTANTTSVTFDKVSATIVSGDRSATNGVLHEIDAVLM